LLRRVEEIAVVLGVGKRLVGCTGIVEKAGIKHIDERPQREHQDKESRRRKVGVAKETLTKAAPRDRVSVFDDIAAGQASTDKCPDTSGHGFSSI
jgi:hypothetical protein